MRALSFLAVVLLASGVARADAVAPEVARARVEHHLRVVEQLTGHFERVMTASCPRFPSSDGWSEMR